MEFSFPPPPPGYTSVLIARGLLVAWAMFGICLLIWRLRRWKFIRSREVAYWIVAAGICGWLTEYARCPFSPFNEHEWIPMTAAIGVSGAGIVVLLCKLSFDTMSSAKEVLWGKFGLAILFVVCAYLLLPGLQYSREASHRVHCRNNLKQIGLAMYNYHDVSRSFPPSAGGEIPVSWRVLMCPYLDKSSMFHVYDPGTAWDESPNSELALKQLPVYSCPSNYWPRDSSGRWFTAYSVPCGPNTIGGNPAGTPLMKITDGSSNTFLAVEACGSQILWTEPRDVDVATQPAGMNLKGNSPGQSAGWISSFHANGANIALADGSVRFLSAKTDPALLKKMATIDGGERFEMP